MKLWIKSRLTGRKIIYLRSYDGTVYKTIEEKPNPFGRWCYVYPLTKIGYVELLENGKTSGESVYIKEWVYES